MDLRTEHEDYKPVESAMPLKTATCHGCVFKDSAVAGCIFHACTPENFPEGHPLAGAEKAIIWVKK